MSAFKITLPDNSIREIAKPISVLEFAHSIGPSLGKDAIGGLIDGKIVDVRSQLTSDGRVEILTAKSTRSAEIFRHSAAHIMAQAIQELWQDVKITIGPVIENGFFYDVDSPRAFVPEDLEKIEKQMKKIVEKDYEIVREVWPVEKAISTFKKMGENFKVEIIEDLKKAGEKEVSIYHQGPWFDLCRGPHIQKTSHLKAFKLLSIAGAYWRGDEKNKMLQRIYGTAFASQKELDAYLVQIEEAKKRDHRKLGKELGLFTFHQLSPAMPFFYPKGTIVYNQLQNYIRELYFEYGYQEVITPQIFDVELFHCSGHYDNYRENMYFTEVDERQFSLKPMNCPGHALLYSTEKHSYKELPWRIADFGRLHRYERTGVVHGLARVRSFSQDDAHIFCTLDQVQAEITSFMEFLNRVYKTLGFTRYQVLFSTRPPKRVGADETWDKAEAALGMALKDLKLDYQLNPGDGAFYGPKLDITVTDAIGRSWQLGTLQCDFNMPERFELEYTGVDNKPHRPVMLHRAILGSFERFVAVYIEHCAGHFPTWMAPTQVSIINITDAQIPYAKELETVFRKQGIRINSDLRNEKLGFKIREAQMEKIPYMVILGDQEVASRTISVRLRTGKEIKNISIEKLNEAIKIEISQRLLTSPLG